MSEKLHPDEEMLGLRMVKDRVLSEAQLSTAMDFQKAVGGPLKDVILRLKFVDESTMLAYLEALESGDLSDEPVVPEQPGAEGPEPIVEEDEPPPELSTRKTRNRPERTISLAAEEKAALDVAAEEDAAPVAGFSDFVEASIVLEALIRILVKKGIIEKAEIKDEVLRMDTSDLLQSGLLQKA